MEYKKLGKSDLEVSRIALGGWQFCGSSGNLRDKKTIKSIINKSLDSGINFIDTAESYGDGYSESVIGEALKERGNRGEVVIATKVLPRHLRYKDVIKAAEKSLKRLQIDTIDLFLIHRLDCYPIISGAIEAFDTLLQEGKVRYVGVSNLPVCLVQEAMELLKNGKIIVNQLEYNVLIRDIEEEFFPFLRKNDIAVMAYSPLATGFLTGKYTKSNWIPEEDTRKKFPIFKKENAKRAKPLFDVMRNIAKTHGVEIPQVAIGWLLKYENVFPVVGAKKIEHVESNLKAAELKLSKEEWSRITEASNSIELDLF